MLSAEDPEGLVDSSAIFNSRNALILVACGCGLYMLKELVALMRQPRELGPKWRKAHGYERYPAEGNFPEFRLHNNELASCLTPRMYNSLR